MVAPAFSDHINDIQPPWTDITFLRLYLDHPTANIKHLDNPKIPPYILFDTIKANLHPGKKPNKVLWRELAKTIPHFQKRFGIDGARIDMGHALPAELLEMIITRARDNDPDFGLIAEELNPDNAKKAKEVGYNIMIGNGFWMEPRFKEGFLQAFIERAIISELPMFATPETHDSKRIAAREGGIVLSRMLAIFNMLLPIWSLSSIQDRNLRDAADEYRGRLCSKRSLQPPKTTFLWQTRPFRQIRPPLSPSQTLGNSGSSPRHQRNPQTMVETTDDPRGSVDFVQSRP